ncbi:unnamed protein product [Rotaria sp. Silwood1]|nr:unnamed protein product [Rotaria sp. Silwood1]CAF4905075.1 unnamed protein product [Rotaria sp. Silwood1]
MGSSHSFSIPHFNANIRTSDGKTFGLSSRDFVDHIVLLRRVIAHPEMTQQAKIDEIIVPTFDIDLIWHTHMRFPLSYQNTSKALCGFLLDHDDSLENDILVDAYQKTAEQWKMTYKVDYGKDIDKDNLRTSQYVSSCAIIMAPVVIYSSSGGGGGCGGVGGGGC